MHPKTKKPNDVSITFQIKRLRHKHKSKSMCNVFEWMKAIQQCASQLSRIIGQKPYDKVIPRVFLPITLFFSHNIHSFPVYIFNRLPFHQF